METQPRPQPQENVPLDLERVAYFQEKLADVTVEDAKKFESRITDDEFRETFAKNSQERQARIVFMSRLSREERREVQNMANSAGYLPGLHDLNNELQLLMFLEQMNALAPEELN